MRLSEVFCIGLVFWMKCTGLKESSLFSRARIIEFIEKESASVDYYCLIFLFKCQKKIPFCNYLDMCCGILVRNHLGLE